MCTAVFVFLMVVICEQFYFYLNAHGRLPSTGTTVCTPSFRNYIFQSHTFLKHHKKNITVSSFCEQKVVSRIRKNLENRFANEIVIIPWILSILLFKTCHDVAFFLS